MTPNTPPFTAKALDRKDFSDVRHEDLLAFIHGVEDAAAKATGSNNCLRVFSEALEDMLAHRHRERPQVLQRIAEVARRTATRNVYPCSGYAPASVVSSVYLCLTSVSFRQAIVDTVNLGGDTDTTGAMVGAITGALYGKSTIPAEWYERLHARDRFDDRVEALIERPAHWVPETPLVALETEWDSLLRRR